MCIDVCLTHKWPPRLLRAHVFLTLRDGKAHREALRDAPVSVVPVESAPVMAHRLNTRSICVSGECQ